MLQLKVPFRSASDLVRALSLGLLSGMNVAALAFLMEGKELLRCSRVSSVARKVLFLDLIGGS